MNGELTLSMDPFTHSPHEEQLQGSPVDIPTTAIPDTVVPFPPVPDVSMAPEIVSPADAPEVAEEVSESRPGRLERFIGAVRRHKVAVAAGAITVASLATNPIGETVSKLADTAPYVGPGMIASEAAWIGGAAMMLAAVGKRLYNPFKIRGAMKDVPEVAANSRLFKTGLAVNTLAALAQFAIPAAAVAKNLPVNSWGILTVSCLDLTATVALRREIWKGIQNNRQA